MSRRLTLLLVAVLLVLAIAATGMYGALALWFHAPFGASLQTPAAIAFGLLGLAAIASLIGPGAARSRRAMSVGLYSIALVAFFGWWANVQPSNDRDWAPDVSRPATASLAGNILTVDNVRDFDWRSDADFTPRWEARVFDLDKLTSLDLVASYWMGEAIAHMMVSFGFSDGRRLLWSIELRRVKGQSFSALAGFFRDAELIYLAADEHDALRVRAKVRGEDVRLYRVEVPPLAARELLLAYVEEANALAAQPTWYNTFTTNCTTMIFKMARLAGGRLPLDWRIFASGFFPDYLYARGRLDTTLPMAELRERAKVSPRAVRIDALPQPEYSRALRAGLPGMD